MVYKDNGDGTALQWMVFSEGKDGELLPPGATDKFVYLKMVQITSENADGTKLIRIGFDEEITKDTDMILPPFILLTVDADGKIVGDVTMIYPFGIKGVTQIKVLAKEVERFAPKSELQIAVEQLGLPEGEYELGNYEFGELQLRTVVHEKYGVVAIGNSKGEWDNYYDFASSDAEVIDDVLEKYGFYIYSGIKTGYFVVGKFELPEQDGISMRHGGLYLLRTTDGLKLLVVGDEYSFTDGKTGGVWDHKMYDTRGYENDSREALFNTLKMLNVKGKVRELPVIINVKHDLSDNEFVQREFEMMERQLELHPESLKDGSLDGIEVLIVGG